MTSVASPGTDTGAESFDPAFEFQSDHPVPPHQLLLGAIAMGSSVVENGLHLLRHPYRSQADFVRGVHQLISSDPSAESTAFKDIVDGKRNYIEGSDGIQRDVMVLPGDPDQPGILWLNPWGTRLRSGMIRASLGEVSSNRPGITIIGMGTEAIDTVPPSLKWYTDNEVSFADLGLRRLEAVAEVVANRSDLPHKYVLASESMGTIFARRGLQAANAAGFDGIKIIGDIQISPAGIEEESLFGLGKDFGLPEFMYLVESIVSTPPEKLPYFLKVLLETLPAKPEELAALLKLGVMISHESIGSDEVEAYGDIPHEIIAGEKDHVAPQQAILRDFIRRVPNSHLAVYGDEGHMKLVRYHKMMDRLLRVYDQITETGQAQAGHTSEGYTFVNSDGTVRPHMLVAA